MTQKKSIPTPSEFDFEAYLKQVVQGLIKGEPRTGEHGLLKLLIAQFIEGALHAEMDNHLMQQRSQDIANKSNGPQDKNIQTTVGRISIRYSHDQNGSFEPVTVKERGRKFALGFEDQILELYAAGSSQEDITVTLRNLYGAEISTSRISGVVNATRQRVDAWHNRRLPSCLVVLFIDAIHLDVRRDGQVRKIALHVAYGVTVEGRREIIALIPGQGSEGAVEWARCLESLRQRGLEDVFNVCSDGLAGLKEVIHQTWPQAQMQRCVVHKSRTAFQTAEPEANIIQVTNDSTEWITDR